MVHLWWGEYLRWQSTSDDVHTPADQPWKLWHLFKLLFVLRPLKYHQNHNRFIFAFAIASPESKFWQNQKTSSGFEGHHYCTTPGTKSSSKKSSLAIYLYKVEWWLFDAHPKHFDQVWVVQGFHHLLMRILNLRRH